MGPAQWKREDNHGGKTSVLKRHASPVWTLGISMDGQKLASADFDGVVIIWDTRSGKRLGSIRSANLNPGTFPRILAFSRDARILIVGDGLLTMDVWDLTKPAKSGLKYAELKEGVGDQAEAGQTVKIHWTGWLKDGSKFDSSKDGKPFEFVLGAGQVIKGLDEGVVGMKVGGKRKLVIPPELGYGARGAGQSIPANAELTFEVELLTI